MFCSTNVLQYFLKQCHSCCVGLQLFGGLDDGDALGYIDETAAKLLFDDLGDIPTAICSLCGSENTTKPLLFSLLIQYFAILSQKEVSC